MSIDAERAYGIWKLLISNEKLYDATIEGCHRELASRLGLEEVDLQILDEFHKERGTRWNVENLRFRTTLEIALEVSRYLPRTIHMLVGKSNEWLLDTFFEYLSHHEWQTLGQCRLSESERFAAYTRKRIMKRRPVPKHFEAVLDFELAVIALTKKTEALDASAWPQPLRATTPEDFAKTVVSPSPTSALIDVPADITPWIKSREPGGEIEAVPITILAHIPGRNQQCKFQRLSAGTYRVFDACDGRSPLGEVASRLEHELGLGAAGVVDLVIRWVSEGVLVGRA